MDHVRAVGAASLGDAKYLRAMIAKSPDDRRKLLDEARAAYTDAARYFALNLLKYYTEPADAQAAGYARETVDQQSTDAILALVDKTNALLKDKYAKLNTQIPSDQDRYEFLAGLERARARIALAK
jgi:hypothetical protein